MLTAPLLAAGIDVGGTKCLGVVLDDDGRVVASARRPTPHGSELVATLGAIVDELAESAGGIVATLGIGLPGLISPAGRIVASPNLRGTDGLDVGDELEALGPWRVTVDNDATAAAHAEWQAGAARGAVDALLVTFGTGIGGGLVVGGAIRRGAHGFAGEIGHITVDVDGRECACGRRGCWEPYASGTALRTLTGGMSSSDLQKEAAAGDDNALALMREYARWVAVGLGSLCNVTDPEIVVVGGGVMHGASMLLPMIREEFAGSMYSSISAAASVRPLPEVALAELGESAGAIGSALLGALR